MADRRHDQDQRLGAWLVDALKAPEDPEKLEVIREHADEMRAYLLDTAGRAAIQNLGGEIDRERLFEIYTAVITPEAEAPFRSSYGPEEEAQRKYEGLAEARARYRSEQDWSAITKGWLYEEGSGFDHPRDGEDALVGKAFGELLVSQLPEHLAAIVDFFEGVPVADPQLQRLLLDTPGVRAAGLEGEAFAKHGVTPTMVINASQSVANTARRHYRLRELPKDRPLFVDLQDGRGAAKRADVLLRSSLIDGVCLATELERPVGERLFDWLAAVVEFRPLLFEGFSSRHRGEELELCPVDEDVDLLMAWGTTA